VAIGCVFKALMMVRPCTIQSVSVINMTLRFSDNPEVLDIVISGVVTSARKFFNIFAESMRVVKTSVRVIPIEPPSVRDAKDYEISAFIEEPVMIIILTDSEPSHVSHVY
jgi:hypothetical protein